MAFKVDNENFQNFLAKNGQTGGILPVPAVYLVDTEARVRFQYVNPDYKTRIDPQTVLAAARANVK